MDTSFLKEERQRIEFVLARDGEQATVDFVRRTHKAYRLCIKHGMAKRKSSFHRTYMLSVIDFRKFLIAHAPEQYRAVLKEIRFS
jgi:hypothetical protein